MMVKAALLVVSWAMFLCPFPLSAQDNYEIQVYGADTVEPRSTMVEFHTNFTAQGEKDLVNGVRPTNHAVHETIEITQGWNDWFETGFYIFTSVRSGDGWDWVGDHIRPRVRIPEKWHWPVGLSLSNEVGYQRHSFSPDTWTWEMRPIIDKKIGPWYLSFNPTFDRSLHGDNVNLGFEFSPNVKVRFFQGDHRRAGILWRPGPGWQFRSSGGTATAVFSIRRFECFTRLGNQFRSWLGRDPLHRSSDHQSHHWPQIQLEEEALSFRGRL